MYNQIIRSYISIISYLYVLVWLFTFFLHPNEKDVRKQLNKSGIFLAKVLHIPVNLASSFAANLTFHRAFPLIFGEHYG